MNNYKIGIGWPAAGTYEGLSKAQNSKNYVFIFALPVWLMFSEHWDPVWI